MDTIESRIGQIKPRLMPREGGGWLAVSPGWARFSVGVVAPTENEAIHKFCTVYGRWVSIVDDTVQK